MGLLLPWNSCIHILPKYSPLAASNDSIKTTHDLPQPWACLKLKTHNKWGCVTQFQNKSWLRDGISESCVSKTIQVTTWNVNCESTSLLSISSEECRKDWLLTKTANDATKFNLRILPGTLDAASIITPKRNWQDIMIDFCCFITRMSDVKLRIYRHILHHGAFKWKSYPKSDFKGVNRTQHNTERKTISSKGV